MIKYRDFTYVGEVTFDAIKSIIIKDNQIDDIRYSFMLHFDESEDNSDPKNAAIISWVERYICNILHCKSRRDCGPDDIIFYNFTSSDYDVTSGDRIVWNRLDTIAGRNKLIGIGINIINVTTKVYNLTKE